MSEPAREQAPQAAAPPPGRLVPAAQAKGVKPLYPAARLITGAVLEAERLRAEARALLEKAQADAQSVRAEARAQADAELDAARNKGFNEGYSRFAGLVTRATQQCDDMHNRFGEEVTRIAFRIAREIIGAELSRAPARMVGVVKGGLEHLRSRFPQRVLVHLHPDDYDVVEAHRGEFAGSLPGDTQFSLIRDSEVNRNDVIFETEMGHYDFGVESQLAEIRKVIGAGD